MAVSRIDLLNHNFSRSFRGYKPEEVDHLLQGVADTLGRLGDEKITLANQITALEAKVAELQQREVALHEMVTATQRMREELKTSTQQEAQFILEAARTKAEEIINQGNMRLARIQEDVASARKLKMQLALKIRAVIETHLQLLEMEREEDEQWEREMARLSSAERPAAKGRDE
jgi:cell division initiation protein